MSVINIAALVILGILLLRKLVLMERFFKARVYLITALLCGLLLFFALDLIGGTGYHCANLPPCEPELKVVLCAEY